MITSKERGLAPFKARRLDRLPMWYGGDPQTTQNLVTYLGAKDETDALYKILGIDFKTVRPRYIGPPLKTFPDGSTDTIWGIRRAGSYYGQAVSHPLQSITSLAELDLQYAFPDPGLWECKVASSVQRWTDGYCVIGGAWAPFFHDAIELLGIEQFMLAMYDHPDLAMTVINRVFAFYLNQTQRAFTENPGLIDFMFIGNDFGTQRALLLSPELWRQFFKPGLIQLVDLAHKHGAVAGLHSCGDIHAIIPDLIEIGMDAINPIQVSAEHMDPAALKRQYGRDIVFFGGIDVNGVLLKGTEQQVRAETRRMIDILGHDGRYIVAPSHDYLLPEVPACNIVAMYDEAKKYS
jgi:uroporphyrinogen decarboxylase